MALKISSWVKNRSEELIPYCRANHISHLNIEDRKCRNLIYNDDIDVRQCWEYIDKNYECYCLEQKDDNTTEEIICNLYNFRISFREKKTDFLVTSEEGNRIFTLKKNQGYFMKCYDMCYVSDASGFALLWRVCGIKLRVFYYDFNQKFSTKIKIRIPNFIHNKEITLYARTILIFSSMYDGRYKGYLIDIISIHNEKEWYHIRSNCYFPLDLDKNLSDTMLVGNDVKDWFDDDENTFSTCKALYIDHKNLIPHEVNEKKFIDMDKPDELEKSNLIILGVFKATVILSPNVNSHFCYLVSYNERLQLKACKTIDLTSCIRNDIRLYWDHYERYIPEVGKMILVTSSNFSVVIDLITFQVSQILEYEMPYLPFQLSFILSKDEKMLNILCEEVVGRPVLLKYNLFKGLSLKDIALAYVVENFSIEEIQAFNLPQFLVREIMTRKT